MTDAKLNAALRRMRPWLRGVGLTLPRGTRAIRADIQDIHEADGWATPLPSGAYLLCVDLRQRRASALFTLLHEAVHACVGWEEGHRGSWLEAAHALGFVGSAPTELKPNRRLLRALRELERSL